MCTNASGAPRHDRRMQRRRPFGGRAKAAGASLALLLTVAGAGLGAAALGAPSAGASAKSPKIVTGGTASYSLLPGDVFTWIIPLESQQAYEPYQTNIEDSTYLPLLWFGTGSKTGIDYKLSIANPPVWSNGDKTVTVHMKNNFKWSTGAAVTSADVKFYFQLMDVGKTKIGNYLPGLLPDNVASVTYPNADTFVMHLKRAYNPTWYTGNELGWIYPLPVQAWDKTTLTATGTASNSATTGGAKAVFTFVFSQAKDRRTYSTNPMWKAVDGPFVISAYDPVTHSATFDRNNHYTGPTKAHLSSYTVYSYTTGTAELDALRSGKITFGYLPYSDLSQASFFKGNGYSVKPWPIFYDEVVELGYTSKTWGPLAKQLYIRQALQHLITQELYIKRTLGGYGLQDYGPVADYPGSNYVAPSIKNDPYPYDPKAAEQLLTSHGWVKGSDGYLVCKRAGTASNDCGKGIPKGRKLTFLYMYSTGTTAFFAEVSAFASSAKSVGIDFRLDGQTTTTMYSIAGVCPTAPPCKWGLAGYAGWFWNYGQYELVPVGEDEFGKGNFWGGGYYTAHAQQLITAAETKSGTQALYADEQYLSKNVASLWWPLQDWEVVAVKKTLSGWQHLNPYANYMPQTWYYTSSG
jgi:peptide/nickel transport system substrate-binding protein